MNLDTSQNPRSLFTNMIICTNVVYDDTLEAVSRTLLANVKVKKRVNGENHLMSIFETEEERLTTLEHEFGIKLSQEEIDGIKGKTLSVERTDPSAPILF